MKNVYHEKSVSSAGKTSWLMVIIMFTVMTSLASLTFGIIQDVLKLDPMIIQITQFGPTIGVFIILLIWRSHFEILPIISGLYPSFSKPLSLLLLITSIIFLCCIIFSFLIGNPINFVNPFNLHQSFLLILIAQLMGAFAEEVGWRGFLQPYLEKKLSVIHAGIIVGLLWGLWHINIFSYGILYTLSFLISAVAMSIILAIMLNSMEKGKIFSAGVFHCMINIGMLLMLRQEEGILVDQIIFTSSCSLLAVIAILMHHGKIKN